MCSVNFTHALDFISYVLSLTMKITILGNNSALPAYGRFPTAQIIEINEQLFLMDCGEGAQMRMQQLWSTFMKKKGIYGDDLLLQCIARKLEKKIQVFYYDEATNAIRMKILFSRELSQEESARLQKTEDKPRASDFQDDSILRLALTQHQYQGSVHYENIIANKVCEHSIGAFLLPGTQLVGIFSCFS